MKLPAYEDDRNGTALIFEWLQRQKSSAGNTSGSACTAMKWYNPNGYVPGESTTTDTDDGTDDDTGDTDTGDGTGDEEPTPTPIMPAAGLAALALGLMMAGRRAL